MTVDELIDKLTEIKKRVGGYTDIEIYMDTDTNFLDWYVISDVQINPGNEEEMISDSVIIFIKEDL